MNIVKNGALFLLIILILGLVLFSVLGGTYVKEGYADAATTWADKVMLASGVTNSMDTSGNSTGSSGNSSGNSWGWGYKNYNQHYDNYDHYNKTHTPSIYYGPNGSTANVMNSDGTFSIVVKGSNGATTVYKTKTPISHNSLTKTHSNGMTAESVSALMKLFSNSTFYGPNDGSARFFTGNDGQYAIEVTKSNGDTIIYTSSNTYTYNYNGTTEKSYNAQPFSVDYVNTKIDKNTTNNKSFQSKNQSHQYDSALPPGIPKSMIPPGQEDLYILKSEVVPPVCPACPACNLQSKSSSSDASSEKCPPCPACARCPEPSFECKKVPNYKSHGSNYESGQNKNSYDDGYDSQEHHGYRRHQQNSSYADYDSRTGNSNYYRDQRNAGYNAYDSRARNNNSSSNYDVMGNYNPTGNPGYLPVPVLSDFSTFGM